MTNVTGIVAQIVAVVSGLSTLAKTLVEIFQVNEDKLRAKLEQNHQITDTKADEALALIIKTSDEVNG